MRYCHLALILTAILFISISCNSKDNTDKNTEATNAVDLCNNLDSLNIVLETDTTNGELYSCRAQLLYDKGDFVNALYDIQYAMQYKGNNIPDLLLLADVYWGLGNSSLARQAIGVAESIDDKDYTVYYALGRHFYLTQVFELSKGYLRRSIELEPNNPYAFSLLGEIELAEGDTVAAINDLHRAIQVDNNFYPAYMQLATINLVQNTTLTPQYLYNALNINPNSTEAIYMLGVYNQQNEIFDEAIVNYKKVYDLDSLFILACYNLGYIYLAEKNVFDSAYIWFDKAVNIDTTYCDAIYNRAYSMELLGNVEDAEKEYRRVLRLDSTHQLAKSRLNDVGQ